MRVPPFSRFRRFTQISAIFMLGIVVGAVIYNAIYHVGYNVLWLHNQDLRVQIEQYQKDIQTLKKYNNTSTVIREIKIRSEESKSKEDTPLDPVTVKLIISQMGSDLEPMRGRSMFDIDTDSKLVRLLLDGKLYIVRDKEYSVKIRTMLVMEGVLQIWVEISPFKRS
ncbi:MULTISPECIES: DUF4044 domain-containing protein [Paenibacillus]|uniref:Sporulation membrane protein YtrI C-terminal domain-containing protein n=1 Tax=Paenibacillus odorifer TaxID=189426 RepID=A0A1R0Z1Q5_9BACL|nr:MULTISPECIES: DUF4044 domain-containing protein [Paenibacillus]AIQ73440.1 hypothetical protein PODO_09350 [Paenibacillus odorifer]AWV32785.1 hypothetical protein CD191_09215 [Paenibacillus odorifer]MEC0134550.1 DUF4044 domain-containing protein [Paenibacillus odorifer]MEC0220470.1 DUF4044 domain-containing protein [Paenibacillus odorifer]OMC75501.1 hypothetical protein BK121_05875 [Paenibacillus odorifer]